MVGGQFLFGSLKETKRKTGEAGNGGSELKKGSLRQVPTHGGARRPHWPARDVG